MKQQKKVTDGMVILFEALDFLHQNALVFPQLVDITNKLTGAMLTGEPIDHLFKQFADIMRDIDEAQK